MFLRILPLLCDPETGDPLTVEITEQEGEDVIEGVLISPSGHRYPIRNRIPRFVEPEIFESVRTGLTSTPLAGAPSSFAYL